MLYGVSYAPDGLSRLCCRMIKISSSLLTGSNRSDSLTFAGAVSDVEMQEHYDEFFEVCKDALQCYWICHHQLNGCSGDSTIRWIQEKALPQVFI